jgi:hypothetical protein
VHLVRCPFACSTLHSVSCAVQYRLASTGSSKRTISFSSPSSPSRTSPKCRSRAAPISAVHCTCRQTPYSAVRCRLPLQAHHWLLRVTRSRHCRAARLEFYLGRIRQVFVSLPRVRGGQHKLVARGDVQRASRSVHHAACIIQRATCNMHRATCDAQRATCNTGLPIDLRRYGALMLRHQTVEHNMCVGPLTSTPEYRHTVYVVFACMYSSVHSPACGVGSSALSVPCIRPAVGMPLRVHRSGRDFDGKSHSLQRSTIAPTGTTRALRQPPDRWSLRHTPCCCSSSRSHKSGVLRPDSKPVSTVSTLVH